MNREQKIVFLKKKILDLKSTIKFKEDRIDEERIKYEKGDGHGRRMYESDFDLNADYISLTDCIIDIHLLTLPITNDRAASSLPKMKMDIYKDLSYVISNIKGNDFNYSPKSMYVLAQNIFGDEMISPPT